MVEYYCEECNAQFREQCVHAVNDPVPERIEEWVGIDGHTYVGDRSISTAFAYHSDKCRCKTDPEGWY